MEIQELKTQIIKTGYLDNTKIGCFFHIKYPILYQELINHTKELDDSYWVNKYLRARVIFLIKYNLDSSKIKTNDKFHTFDRKKDDFVNRTENYAIKGWKSSKESIPNKIYDKETTIITLKKDNYYKNFFGKSKNRILIKTDPILYNSIYHHTKLLDDFNKNNNKLSSRIVFLVKYDGNESRLKCDVCNENYTSYNTTINDFNRTCKICFNKIHHYPHKEYFKRKYGDEWEIYYTKDRQKVSEYKVNSLQWYIKKYGEEDGRINYQKFLTKRLDILNQLTTSRSSKISQNLFWLIYEKLTTEEKENCFFKELNYEKLLKVSESKYYFPDFLFNNKIIEYDGMYWHNDSKDEVRNDFYKKKGFDVLTINETDFNRNRKNPVIITKCLNFLRSEIK